jgi:precorrin-2 methylase
MPGDQETLTIKGLQTTSQAATIVFIDEEKGAIGSLDVTVKKRSLFRAAEKSSRSFEPGRLKPWMSVTVA